jgi:hypothetical protein
MREAIETYRGIPIFKSDVVLCDSGLQREVPTPCEAVLDGWRLIGPLTDVKTEIDRRLGGRVRG